MGEPKINSLAKIQRRYFYSVLRTYFSSSFFSSPPEARFNRLLSHDDQFAISVKSLFFLDTNRIGAVGSGPYAGFLLSVKC
jgi:hypothetical protein